MVINERMKIVTSNLNVTNVCFPLIFLHRTVRNPSHCSQRALFLQHHFRHPVQPCLTAFPVRHHALQK